MENLVMQSSVRSDCERLWPGNKSVRQWVKIEHYRLHCAEEWPNSPYKETVLAAARSALERLETAAIEPLDAPACIVCATRRAQARRVLMFPSKQKVSPVIMKPAA